MNLLDIARQPPKNRHLLAAIAAAALLDTLICLGLLFGENANKRAARALQARIELVERDDGLRREVARLAQSLREVNDGITRLDASQVDQRAVEQLRAEIGKCRGELEALFKRDLAEVRGEIAKARKADQP
ncbi:MAG: hypothetical protein U1E76_03680 [Planctomycetota bacterium]